jgi:pyrroline-5-carboxylate reductase
LKQENIAILGAGNIGSSIARGLVDSNQFRPEQIFLTRRNADHLAGMREQGFRTGNDNVGAVLESSLIVIAVEPQQIDGLIYDIRDHLVSDRHVLISVVSGVTIAQIEKNLKTQVPVVRAMPNTAITLRESMTCLASKGNSPEAVKKAHAVFGAVGKTLQIDEEQMLAATALGACGIAFFLRAIRAASQGGIEVGFHSDAALTIAAQTAKGAASLLLTKKNHPEAEIDRVTTPRGCTIAGLNRMEHEGFSSAMIKGILTSAEIAGRLYPDEKDE